MATPAHRPARRRSLIVIAAWGLVVTLAVITAATLLIAQLGGTVDPVILRGSNACWPLMALAALTAGRARRAVDELSATARKEHPDS